MVRRQSSKIEAEIDLLDQSVNALRQRIAPKTHTKARSADVNYGQTLRVKRPYRNLNLILLSLPC